MPSLPTRSTLSPARVQKRTHFNFTSSYRCREALLRDVANGMSPLSWGFPFTFRCPFSTLMDSSVKGECGRAKT